ncbi:chemotaxis protein CheD [Pradoshia sp. D12]|uniref:chemotaxis protein CheD n=1 Tax=Bacillaceae TaxID=186817 RepID=UPI00080AF550|nr:MULTISPECIES: chemotaxis protein CheD [Bacillaceae]OCA89613.1 chemotaxis protein CheD [Bacillus sp. FJAT-27986]QFK71002.1 chemotaxis protein CheD [Pradoshia sp. D12]TPF72794.1 chemotaxis protein CheD [Bacillus sp. D12]
MNPRHEQEIIRVGIADMNFAYKGSIIRTAGLGSCVGVVLYCPSQQIAGMVHVMLPDSSLARGKTFNKAKYADTAIPELIKQFKNKGIKSQLLKAKLAGGAQMFQFSSGSDLMRIGPRNVDAVKIQLMENHIQIIAEDVGGNSGRTIEFNPITSILHIRTVNQGSCSI